MTNPPPVIGITAHEGLVDDGVGVAVRHHLTNVAYAKAVRKAGGIPVLLPMVDPADAATFLAAIRHEPDPADVPAAAGPRAVGALPFAGPGTLVVPSMIVGRDADGRGWCTTIDDGRETNLHVASSPPSQFQITACTAFDEWRGSVAHALGLIGERELEKVVLARAVRVAADRPWDLRALLADLRRTQHGCTVYADRGFVGASPELLVRKHGTDVMSRPLAGTGSDTSQLLASTKDAHEHRLVVDSVVGALAAECGVARAVGPAPLILADMTHLATTVTARSSNARTSVVSLMRALHPTPAVAGTPRERALDVLRDLEPVARGRYAGPCGWVNERGDGEFVVALRGAAIDGPNALLHAGAGIVSGSDAAAEWAETQQKLEPMLRVLVRP